MSKTKEYIERTKRRNELMRYADKNKRKAIINEMLNDQDELIGVPYNVYVEDYIGRMYPVAFTFDKLDIQLMAEKNFGREISDSEMEILNEITIFGTPIQKVESLVIELLAQIITKKYKKL